MWDGTAVISAVKRFPRKFGDKKRKAWWNGNRCSRMSLLCLELVLMLLLKIEQEIRKSIEQGRSGSVLLMKY